MRFWIRCFLRSVPVLLSSGACGRPAAEFLIVERPANLSVLNSYEQEATAAERAFLRPFAPLRVLDADILLSDGFTRSMRIEVGGEVLFLLLDEQGALAGHGAPGLVRTHSLAVPLGDSIVVLRGEKLTFSPSGGPSRTLSAGEHLVRVFRSRQQTYCAIGGASPEYGWVDFSSVPEGTAWKRLEGGVAPQAAITPDAVTKIRNRLSGVNRVLQSLYSRFNAETGRTDPAPHWEMNTTERGIVCALTGTVRPGLFAQSTEILSREIQNIVLGSGVRVETGPGSIQLRLP
jgi:hypothetical protein